MEWQDIFTTQWFLDDPDPRSPDAAQICEDTALRDFGRDVEAFFVSAHQDEAIFRFEDRNAEWAKLKQTAESAAKKDNIDTGNPDSVRKYLQAAMSEYDAAIFGNQLEWDYLPNITWRIRAARRHGDKIVAAMLYKEAADAAKAEAAREKEEYAAWDEYYKQLEVEIIAAHERRNTEYERRPRRGRPRNPNGPTGYRPTKAKLLAMITFIELVRNGTCGKLSDAVSYCKTHTNEKVPESFRKDLPKNGHEDGCADYNAFTDGGKAMNRWARYNNAKTPSELCRIFDEEWKQIKPTLH